LKLGVAGTASRALTALTLLFGVAASAPAAATGPAPLEQARHAAEHTAFEGVVEVRWRDGGVTRSERLTVEAAEGALMVRGDNRVMAQPAFGRLISHRGGGWEELWLPSQAPGPRPDGASKYRTTAPGEGPPVAGRPTKVVEIHRNGALLERILLDTQTDLLLARDQFDAQGAVVRSLAFQSVKVGSSTSPPAEPRSPAHHAPRTVALARLASPAAAPEFLADGYQRMGIYRTGAVQHVLYSDGMYDLSVFEQQGRLRQADVPPAGERLVVGAAGGWRYAWPGGQLVVWSTGGRVYTAVSDAPADQVLAAIRSLPAAPGRTLSLLGKVRRACQALMEPLS